MVGPIATTLLAGARMPAGATSNMKRKVPRATADRVAARQGAECQKLASFPAEGEVFFLDIPFIEPHFVRLSAAQNFVGSLPPSRAICAKPFWPRAWVGT